MKKIISLLSFVLTVALLLCTFASCAQKSNMLDMATALYEQKLDVTKINVEKIDGDKYPEGMYITNGSADYSELTVTYTGGTGGVDAGVRKSAWLAQTTNSTEIIGGSEENNFQDYIETNEYSRIQWFFDSTTEAGDYITGYVSVELKDRTAGGTTSYFSVEYTLYELEPFTKNVNADSFFGLQDLQNIEITAFAAAEGVEGAPAQLSDLSAEQVAYILEFLNRDLVRLVKACETAGYPVVIPE